MNNKETIHLSNFTEILVDETLKDLRSKMDNVCTCKRCTYDIKAIALNNLPPKYTVTHKGELYSKLSYFREQTKVDVIKEVLKAIMIVKENCSHDLTQVASK